MFWWFLGIKTDRYQQENCTGEGVAGDNDKNGGSEDKNNGEKTTTFFADSFLPKETILMLNLLNKSIKIVWLKKFNTIRVIL